MSACFLPARILLPAPGTPLSPWACIAVDQFTSQPEYWQQAEALADGQPSTLHIVLPEAYLGTPQERPRLQQMHRAMRDYRRTVLSRTVQGFVYVERTLQNGAVRQGLVGMVDLEAYSYLPGQRLPIRPSESTVLARIPPRLAARRGAELESPHILMLADDAGDTLIGPIAAHRDTLPCLYSGELMLGGGRLAGWAVEDPALVAGVQRALEALADPDAFAARWPGAVQQQPLVLAVGDGNHSLATAKAFWEELKPTLPLAQRAVHPARYCLAEVCVLQSPALAFEPIHRVLFGVQPSALCAELRAWLEAQGADPDAAGGRCVTVAGAGYERRLGLAGAPDALAVGTVERFVEEHLARCPQVSVDYIHGGQTARALAQRSGGTTLLLPALQKDDVFRGVVLGGVLPRKTFSMGHAEEKRYYNECRSLVCEN